MKEVKNLEKKEASQDDDAVSFAVQVETDLRHLTQSVSQVKRDIAKIDKKTVFDIVPLLIDIESVELQLKKDSDIFKEVRDMIRAVQEAGDDSFDTHQEHIGTLYGVISQFGLIVKESELRAENIKEVITRLKLKLKNQEADRYE